MSLLDQLNPYRLVAEIAIVATLCGAAAFCVIRYGQHRYEAGQADIQDKWDAQMVEVQKASLKESARRDSERDALQTKLAKVNDDFKALREEKDRDDAANAAVLAGLRHRIAAAERSASSAMPGNPATAGDSAPTTAVGAVLNECAAAYLDMAGQADSARLAGLECERRYDSLTEILK